MANRGKLEGQITSPTGGWSISVNEGGGAQTVTIPAGTYYLSTADSEDEDLLKTLEDALNDHASLSLTYTVSIDAGENGSGKVTISATDDFDLEWGSTDLRDLLGFEADLENADSYESPKAARSLWLPDIQFQDLVGASGNPGGWKESNLRMTESDGGHVYALSGQRKTARAITWPAVHRRRTWLHAEEVGNQSFERFWQDVILGEAAWSASPAGPVRFHPDASQDGTYRTYKIASLQDFRPDMLQQHWTGRYRIEIPRMVEHPGGGTATVTAVLLLDAEFHTPNEQALPETAAALAEALGE